MYIVTAELGPARRTMVVGARLDDGSTDDRTMFATKPPLSDVIDAANAPAEESRNSAITGLVVPDAATTPTVANTNNELVALFGVIVTDRNGAPWVFCGIALLEGICVLVELTAWM